MVTLKDYIQNWITDMYIDMYRGEEVVHSDHSFCRVMFFIEDHLHLMEEDAISISLSSDIDRKKITLHTSVPLLRRVKTIGELEVNPEFFTQRVKETIRSALSDRCKEYRDDLIYQTAMESVRVSEKSVAISEAGLGAACIGIILAILAIVL